MRVTLINGSPKSDNSASGVIINELVRLLRTQVDVNTIKAMNYIGHYDDIIRDTLVLVFPLYCDGVPSHLLRFMEQMYSHCQSCADKPAVYAVINAGFFEGIQCKPAMDIVKNWANRTGLVWSGGVGIGGGGMIADVQKVPFGKGPKKSIGKALDELARHIAEGNSMPAKYVNHNFPRFLYRWLAHHGWKSQAKKNGTTLGKAY